MASSWLRQRWGTSLCVVRVATESRPFFLNTGVGKSCLLLRFSEESFTPSFITTIG